jgi:hypothetical protein
MTLGDHVRLVRSFVEAFNLKAADNNPDAHSGDEGTTAPETAELAQLRVDLTVDLLCSPLRFLTSVDVPGPTGALGNQR